MCRKISGKNQLVHDIYGLKNQKTFFSSCQRYKKSLKPLFVAPYKADYKQVFKTAFSPKDEKQRIA